MGTNENRIDFESHRRAQQDEDVQFLVQHGVSLEEACRRAGANHDTMVKRAERQARKEREGAAS